MTLHHQGRSQQIAALNDQARQTFQGCRVVLTEGILALSDADRFVVLHRVRAFDAFTPDNDPHGEHDFGGFEFEGQRIYWKIDYYDRLSIYRSPDPTSTEMTNRVLTVMLATEY